MWIVTPGSLIVYACNCTRRTCKPARHCVQRPGGDGEHPGRRNQLQDQHCDARHQRLQKQWQGDSIVLVFSFILTHSQVIHRLKFTRCVLKLTRVQSVLLVLTVFFAVFFHHASLYVQRSSHTLSYSNSSKKSTTNTCISIGHFRKISNCRTLRWSSDDYITQMMCLSPPGPM